MKNLDDELRNALRREEPPRVCRARDPAREAGERTGAGRVL